MTLDEIEEINPDALLCDGYDGAIIGMAERVNLGPVVAYSVEKMIKIMMDEQDMSYEDALEYFDFNIRSTWVGEFTPIFITTNED